MEKKNLIMFNTITQAMRAQELLAKHSIKSRLVRTPKNKSEHGCGYSLYVPQNIGKAADIVRSSGIRIAGEINDIPR